MPRFLSVLEIWRFGSHHHPVPEAQIDEQHTETDTRGEMTADQVNPQVTNKLLSPDTSAVRPWPESTSEEQNVPSQRDDYSGYDDVRADTFCSTVNGILPFTSSLMEDSLNDSDSHNLIWSSKAHHINRNSEVAQSLPGLSAPVVFPWDSNSSCIGTQPAGLMQTKAKAGHCASNELWLNAGQVPAGEEECTILDEHNKCSDVTSFAGGRAGDRKKSGYPLGTEAAIGLPSDDSCLRTPPVETWSSADSWSGAHSNTVHIVLPSPDESPATVTQTLEAMAIKDKEPEPLQGQENNDTAEQMCLITDAKKDGELTAERGVEKVQTLLKTQAGDTSVHSPDLRDKGDKETPLTEEHSFLQTSEEERCSSLPCTVASQNICESDTTCILPFSEDITVVVSDIVKDLIDTRERTPVGEADMDTYRKKKTPSQAFEVERCQDTSEEPQTPEPETDALWEVTEDAISQLHLDVKKGVESETSAVEPVHRKEPGHSIERLQRAEVIVHTSHQTQAEETGFEVRQKDKPLHACPQGETNERPGFIMPLAPLSQRSSHVHADTASERGQQRTKLVKTTRNGAFDRTRPFSLENQAEKLLAVGKGEVAHSVYPPGGHDEKLTCSGQSLDEGCLKPSSPGESQQSLDTKSCEASRAVSDVSKELSKLFIHTGNKFAVCVEDKMAYITLNLDDIACSVTSFGVENGNRVDHASPLEHNKTEKTPSVCESEQKQIPKMSHKTPSGCKTPAGHKSKEKPTSRQEKSKQADAQASKTQQAPLPESLVTCESSAADSGNNGASVVVIETIEVITEKCTRSSSKKKKKQSQHASGKVEAEPSKAVESSAQPKTPKGKTNACDASPAVHSGSKNDKPSALTSKTDCLQMENLQKQSTVKDVPAAKGKGSPVDNLASAEGRQPAGLAKQPGEGFLKRRRVFEDKGGKRPAELKPQKPSPLAKRDEQAAPAEAGQRKSYSEVVKQKSSAHKEVPKVLQNITAETLLDDPGSINLWCQFGALSVESFVVWTKEGMILAQAKRSTGDESRLSFQVSKASSKDLGRYQCCLSCPIGRLTSEFHLTSDVLNELIPCQNHTAEVVEGVGEDVRCAPLLFKDDFLNERYFGENQPASIMTEEAHFGEGMYRRAFRTKLLSGALSPFAPGHPCVLKVHNAVSHGTNNNEDLVLKNYDLAVEECHVQNTAREYIKAYTTTAKSAEEFGEVPEIIPIFLVHRPSNDIPYATLEEELIGDFVKYSVKDGKEINLKRQDSEPGQKCCAFQHWVYNMTEGNLLVTDMQGVGMKLTDVGIATPKKGYKGFKGNCATSFIDQFKALHQCNKFCELLGLKSLQPSQPRPRKAATAPKPKPQPQLKKKVFVFSLKSKT